jgi:tetratricopeptide (TPR) repeat protein
MGPISALRAGLIAVIGLAASACAGGPVFLPADDGPQSAYGAVLSASYASRVRDVDASSRLYGEALSFEPDSALVTERAFLAALTAGDFRRADLAAQEAILSEGASQLAHRYVDAARLAGARLVASPATESDADPFSALVAGILVDWMEAKAGRDGRRAVIDRVLTEPMDVTGYRLVHRALLFEVAGRMDEAEAAYRAADASLDLRDFTTVLLGEFLERQGRREDARLLYRAQIARDAGQPDAEVAAALARVEVGGRPPRRPDEEAAAARALFGPAAFLAMQAPPEYATLYLRLIERVDPDFDRGRMALGGLLEQVELNDQALAVYDRLNGSAFAYDAGVSAAWLRFRLGQVEAAVEAARRLSSGPPYNAELALADMLRFTGACGEALEIYDRVIAARTAAGEAEDWRPVFYAALCTEQVSGWAHAEPLHERALELAPNEPIVLNHLGYSWIIGGERVDEGVDLTARAAALAPENGSVLDSFGWGLFKVGRTDDAVRWLERAAAQSPANPTIQWHLGDAYAAVGRTLEAQFQWRRALELDPDPEEIDLLNRRLELGLEAGPADVS